MLNRDIRTEATDLRATDFRDALIWLPGLIMASFQAGERVVTARTFTNCLLYGPAVFLAVKGVAMEHCNLGANSGDIRNLVLRPVSPTGVIGAVPFDSCRFEWCDFEGVCFTGNDAFVDSILSLPTGDLS